MNLESKRLRLTEAQVTDIADIHEMNSFPQVAQYNTIGIPATIEDTRRVLAKAMLNQLEDNRKHYAWVIREKTTRAFVGEIGLNVGIAKYQRGEIYYGLHPKQWGNGFGTEAAIRVLDFAFDSLKLHRIEAGVHVDNVPSIKLLERIGMQREGCCRGILPIRGTWHDNYMYAILEIDRK